MLHLTTYSFPLNDMQTNSLQCIKTSIKQGVKMTCGLWTNPPKQGGPSFNFQPISSF